MPTRLLDPLAAAPPPRLPIDWATLLDPAPPRALAAALDRIAAQRVVEPGQSIFARGQPARDLVAVLAGTVALGRRGGDGRLALQRRVAAREWLDLGSAWLGDAHGEDAVALGRVRVLELPARGLRALLPDQPGLAEALLAALAREARVLADLGHDLMHKDAGRRVADWLLERCLPAGQDLLVPLHERKRDIAAELAVAPETLSRCLRQLREQGLIAVEGYRITVLDLQGLKALAREAPGD
ncbi:MAG: Crp/Fnr family transcriptional regulator [Pelomonas sp.]|nr:Crp/Fnr family transcriptional regulator [Roseateles sp.]